MIQSPEQRIAALEQQVKELTSRVNTLEFTNMAIAKQPWPAPVPGVTMGIAYATNSSISPDTDWPFPKGTQP